MIAGFINDTGFVPLGERELRIPDKRMVIIAGVIMLGAVRIVTLGMLPAPVGSVLEVLASILLRTVPLQKIYRTTDWPIIVLLAALIPVANAMQTTGAAEPLAQFLVKTIAQSNPVGPLAVVLITTMFHVERDEQCRHTSHSVSHCPWNCRHAYRRSGQFFNGSGDWRFLRLSHSDQASE